MQTAELDNPSIYPPLDPDKFEIIHDVAIFDEHEDTEPERDETGHIKRDAEGNATGVRRIKYNRAVLEAICENQNRRIRDTGDYTAICVGHTPTPEERRNGTKPQPAIGMAGPYYVAELGKENPRPCIFARNWAIYKEDADVAKSHPRRSVELWAEPDLKDRFFDPISVLGSEMPRRDLGLVYSRANPRTPVVRYSAVFPSGGNTFVPGADDKERYSKPQNEETPGMLAPEDIQQIVAAVMETAPMQYVTKLMQAEQAKGDPTQVEAAAPTQNFAEPELDDNQPPADATPADGTPVERNSEPEMNDDEKKELYRRQEADKIRYSRIEAENQRLTAANKSLESRVAAIEGTNRQVVRYSQIRELANEFVFDEEAELKRADMFDDARWNEHVELIKTNYARNPVGRPPLPTERLAVPATAKRAEARDRRIREKIETYSREGVHKGYHEIEAEVDKELGAAA
jgi:hypothetical protein